MNYLVQPITRSSYRGYYKSVRLFGAIVHVTVGRSLNQSIRMTYSSISNIRSVRRPH